MFLSVLSSLATFVCLFLLVYVLGSEWLQSTVIVWRRFRKRWNLNEDSRSGERTPKGLELPEHTPFFIPSFKPNTDLKRRQIKLGLVRAGIRHGLAVAWYVSLRIYLAAVGFLVGAGLHAGFGGWSLQNPLMGLLGAAFGYWLPQVGLQWLQKRRRQTLQQGLPDALDLMAMSVACGNGVQAAMRDAARELRDTSPVLASEFQSYFAQLDLGTDRRIALQDLALRAGLKEMTSLTNLLMQSHRMGCSVAQALQDLSHCLRVQRRQRAEERARSVAVKMTFPLILFIFPGIFVVLVGPAAISVMRDVLALN